MSYSDGASLRIALDLVASSTGASSLYTMGYALSSLLNTTTTVEAASARLTSALAAQESAGRRVTTAALSQESATARLGVALGNQEIAAQNMARAERELNDAMTWGSQADKDAALQKYNLASQAKLAADASVTEAESAQGAAAARLEQAQADQALAAEQVTVAQTALDEAAAQDAATLSLNSYVAALLAAAGMAAGFDLALKQVVTDASNLQYTSTQMDLALHGTADQIDALNPKIIQWADNSLYTTAQVHQLVQALSEHGLDVSSILNGDGQAAIQFGEAIGGDPVSAANLLGSALQQFSSQGLNAKDAADILTATFYNGIPSATELQQAYDQVGGQAATMGVSFKDLSATLDLLAQAGLKGSSAAAGLRYMLQTLDDPTTKAATDMNFLGLTVVNQTSPAFERLKHKLDAAGAAGQAAVKNFDGTSVGLNAMFKEAQKLNILPMNQTFNEWAVSSGAMSSKLFDAKGHFIGLQGAMQQLFAAVQQKSGGNKEVMAQLLGDMFNVRSGRDAGLLANMPDLSSHYARVKAEMGKPNQSANDATKMKDTLKGSWQQFTTTMTSLGATIGTELLPPLTHLIQMLNGFVSTVMSANPGLLKFIGIFLVVGAVLSTVAAIVLILVVVFTVIAAVVGGAVLLAFGVVIVVILVVAAVVALVIVNWGHLVKFFQSIPGWIGGVFSWLGTAAHHAVSAVGGWFNWLGIQVHGHLMQLVNKARQIWDSIPALFKKGLDAAEKLVESVFKTIGGWFGWLYNHNYYFQALVDFIRAAWKNIQTDASKIWSAITTWLSNAWKTIQNDAKIAWEWVETHVIEPVQRLWNKVQYYISLVKHFIKSTWDTIVKDASTAWSNFVGTITGIVSTVSSAVQTNIIKPITDKLGGLASSAYTWATNMLDMFKKGIQDGVGDLGKTVQNVGFVIRHMLGFHSPPAEGPLADSDQYMPNMMRMYAAGINQHTPLLAQAATNAANTTRFALTQGMAPNGLLLGGGAGVPVGGNQTVVVQVGNQQLFQLMMNQLTGQMQLNGMGRAFK